MPASRQGIRQLIPRAPCMGLDMPKTDGAPAPGQVRKRSRGPREPDVGAEIELSVQSTLDLDLSLIHISEPTRR
eukprot:800174-Lingulodinium_polyedra.AAC.1